MNREPRPSKFEREIAELVTHPLAGRQVARIAHRLACDRIPPVPNAQELAMVDELTREWLQGWTVGLSVVRSGNRQVFLRIGEDPNNIK